MVLTGTLVPVIHADKKETLVGCVAIEACATEQCSGGNIFFSPEHFCHLAVDRQGFFVGYPIRRLNKTDGVTLVFNRHKATRDAGKGKCSEKNATRQGRHHNRSGLDHSIKD